MGRFDKAPVLPMHVQPECCARSAHGSISSSSKRLSATTVARSHSSIFGGIGLPKLRTRPAPELFASSSTGSTSSVSMASGRSHCSDSSLDSFVNIGGGALPKLRTRPAPELCGMASVRPCGGVEQPSISKTQRSGRRSRKVVPMLKVSDVDLLCAVESLYRDELKPYGRLLRKRLQEQDVAVGLSSGEAGLVHLRVACEKLPELRIEPAQGGEYVAYLVGKEVDFVDVYSPENHYPETFWAEARVYFGGLTETEGILPGGRFSCAQCLIDRSLPFLSRYSLGKVCHIVQLAISQKKILGYGSEGITPYARSQSMLKDKAAQSALLACRESESKFATWGTLRCHLIELLGLDGDSEGTSVALSDIKRLFRSKFDMEVCETALGHSKLSELLQDKRLGYICTVKLLDTGYYVVPTRRTSEGDSCSTEAPSQVSSGDESEQSNPRQPKVAQQTKGFGCTDHHLPLTFQAMGFVVHNTFIDIAPTRAATTFRRSHSLPRSFETSEDSLI